MTASQEHPPAGPTDVHERTIDALEIEDCINRSTAPTGEISIVKVVDCRQAHELEMFVEIDLPDGDYAGEDATTTAGLIRCAARFRSYIGVDLLKSQYDVVAMVPTAASWALGDRRVSCFIVPPNAPATGSAHNSNR